MTARPTSSRSGAHGPLEDLEWAKTLRAHVFTPGPRPHMHGYDVYGDLAQHYRASDLVLTGLRGEPPTPAESEIFDAALSFLCPVCVSEAPTHAALLSRACGAPMAPIASVGVIALAEETMDSLRRHSALLDWLDSPLASPPVEFRCRSKEEREAVELLALRIRRSGLDVPILLHDPTLFAAVLAVCHRCGLTSMEPLAAVIMAARLPGLLAEGLATPRGDRRAYPLNLPPFRYRDDDDDDEESLSHEEE